jgi:hypothetical protein
MHHVPTGKWSYAETNVNRVASFSTSAVTLEGLDTYNASDIAADSDNRVGIRSVGRYHRFRVIPSGNWNTMIGLDVDVQPAGTR